MQRILAALTTAIAFVFSTRGTIAALKKQIADRDQTISDLLAALDAENADDAALEAAAAAARAAQAQAEAELAAIIAANSEATAKADELFAAISADPAIPISVDPDGTVTSE